MAMKYLRKERANRCPIHKMVVKQAIVECLDHGAFHKDDLLDELNLSAISESIRWDYVREFIEAEVEGELIPLRNNYFVKNKQWRKQPPEKVPGIYVATAGGQRTAGYALVCKQNEHLAIAALSHREASARAKHEKVKDSVTKALRQDIDASGVLDGPAPQLGGPA